VGKKGRGPLPCQNFSGGKGEKKGNLGHNGGGDISLFLGETKKRKEDHPPPISLANEDNPLRKKKGKRGGVKANKGTNGG